MMSQAVFILLLCISTSHAAYEDARCKCLCTHQSGNGNNTKPTMYVKATSADKCTCKFMLGREEALCPYCECTYQVRNTTTIKVVVFLILVVISGLTLYMVFLLLLEPLLSVGRSMRRQADDAMPASVSSASQSDGLSEGKLHRSTLWRFIASPLAGLKKAPPSAVDGQKRSPHLGADVRNHSDNPAAGEVESYRYQRFNDSSHVLGNACNQAGNASSRVWSGVAVPLPGPSAAPGTGVYTVVNRVRDQQQRWKGNVEAQRARVFSEHTLLN